MFKKQQPQPTFTINDKEMITVKLLSNYTTVCAKACLVDFNSGLGQTEKKCLAKCIDRSADYLKLVQKKVDSVPVKK